MLVLSKNVNHIINITASPTTLAPTDPGYRESIAKVTKSIILRPWTINVLNEDEEKVFEHERKHSPQVKYWLGEGILKVIALGSKRDHMAEEAAAVEAEEKAQDAAAELESASKPADKAKAKIALAKAKEKSAKLRAIADAPEGLGDTMPKTLEKVEDTRMAADLVEGVIDLALLNTYLRAEKRSVVQQAIKDQIDRVKKMEGKAKELQEA